MEREFSTPLTEFPTYLSTISMVVDDRASIIKSLIYAERKSPPRYEPARALFRKVLQGDFSVEQALVQARELADTTERKCALDILNTSKKFLRGEPPARVGDFPRMSITLPNGMELAVAPVLLRHLESGRLMILHFWETPLSARQLSAAGAVLRIALSHHQPTYSDKEIDFISVSVPGEASLRRFEQYNWARLKPLSDDELTRFWTQLCAAWSEYQRKEPREIKRKREAGMFG